jgi:RNA polymerase sigma factor (sigma-70 family)
MDDAAVMTLVREGRVEQLAILFERHHVKLFSFFMRLTGDRGTSEDLVQELFLRVLKYRRTYQAGSPPVPWMFGIARNLHLSHLRGARPEVQVDALLDATPAATETPFRSVERGQEAGLLREALARLPLRKRELLLLSRQEDLKYKDIAALRECSLEAVKVQVHRALKELRTIFFELQGGTS